MNKDKNKNKNLPLHDISPFETNLLDKLCDGREFISLMILC